ncbi:hypothetical protein [Stenotrophomonas sp.]|uniref:hypothetical protein n=1 Tax=Lysobacteraceae TaxID=32033 RepID=UPI0025CCC71F|nr:hypothetical protein [Stenotrophomonas sp.]MBW8375003.1 hypothetical protein [Stenotrophomonas sp.]HDS1082669.1 hypothetical protein [Stenotrophomonas maltophilia]
MSYINLSELDSTGRNNILMDVELAHVVQNYSYGDDIQFEYSQVFIIVSMKVLEQLRCTSDESADLSFSFYTQIGTALVKINVTVVDNDALGESITTTIELEEVMYVE